MRVAYWRLPRLISLPIANTRDARLSWFLDSAWFAVVAGIASLSVWITYSFVTQELSWADGMQAVGLTFVTMARVVILLLLATSFWVPVSVWIGLRPAVAERVQPLVQFLAAFPANVIFPVVVVAILHYRLNPDVWLSPLIILGTQWYIVFNVIAGASAFPNDLKEVAASFGAKGWQWWRSVILPGIFPYYVTGALTASGASWNASIVAEYVRWGDDKVAAHGIGAYIAQATEAGDYQKIVLGIAVMSLFVILFNRLLWRPLFGYAERRLRLSGWSFVMATSSALPLLEIRHVDQRYAKSSGDEGITILDDVNLTLRSGEIVGLLGRSGCGKSSLLRIVSGLVRPSTGDVVYQGEPITGPAHGVAMVFQSFALFPWLSVLENVEFGLRAMAVPEEDRRSLSAIDLIGLDGFESAYPKELSGGMRQRVGFARALVVNPSILLMDEPFSALDVLTAETLRTDLLDLWCEGRMPIKSILMVTHNIEEAVLMCDRILVLSSNPGRISAELTVTLKHPRNRLDPEFRQLVDTIYARMTLWCRAGKPRRQLPRHRLRHDFAPGFDEHAGRPYRSRCGSSLRGQGRLARYCRCPADGNR
jgi:ABC-type nitrate/sulfonate/bicarbonate transport system ATPase subunit/ABC-type nitrate/sulfonate/bicarbonate transport system permease component